MSDPISQINLWCQKEGKSMPTYQYAGMGTNWVCQLKASWLKTDIMSENCTSKKLAKSDAAEQALSKIKVIEKVKLHITKPTVFMIDGDQRVDCWRWLASPDVKWDSQLEVIVFTSPTSHQIESEKKIIVEKAKTTNKDSADALILMTLGRKLVQEPGKRYVLISSDHILVQAAEDSEGVEWVNNLKSLKDRFT